MKNHEDDNKTLAEMKDIQESYHLTDENKKKFICESFKIDENKILDQYEKR